MERSAPPPDREFDPTPRLFTNTTGRERSHCRPRRSGVGEAPCRALPDAGREGMDCGPRTRIKTGVERGPGDCTQPFPACRWIRGCRRGFSSRIRARAECDRARDRYAPRSCNLHRSRWDAGPAPPHRDHGARWSHVVSTKDGSSWSAPPWSNGLASIHCTTRPPNNSCSTRWPAGRATPLSMDRPSPA